MKRLLLILALGTAFGSFVFAQTASTPDLSGTWKLNLAKSKVSKKNANRSEFITITTSGDMIQFHYAADPKDRMYTYTPDGKQHPLLIWAENDDSSVTATWKGSVLVIETTIRTSKYEVIHSIDRWSLSNDGRTLMVDPGPGSKLLYLYDKQ